MSFKAHEQKMNKSSTMEEQSFKATNTHPNNFKGTYGGRGNTGTKYSRKYLQTFVRASVHASAHTSARLRSPPLAPPFAPLFVSVCGDAFHPQLPPPPLAPNHHLQLPPPPPMILQCPKSQHQISTET